VEPLVARLALRRAPGVARLPVDATEAGAEDPPAVVDLPADGAGPRPPHRRAGVARRFAEARRPASARGDRTPERREGAAAVGREPVERPADDGDVAGRGQRARRVAKRAVRAREAPVAEIAPDEPGERAEPLRRLADLVYRGLVGVAVEAVEDAVGLLAYDPGDGRSETLPGAESESVVAHAGLLERAMRASAAAASSQPRMRTSLFANCVTVTKNAASSSRTRDDSVSLARGAESGVATIRSFRSRPP